VPSPGHSGAHQLTTGGAESAAIWSIVRPFAYYLGVSPGERTIVLFVHFPFARIRQKEAAQCPTHLLRQEIPDAHLTMKLAFVVFPI